MLYCSCSVILPSGIVAVDPIAEKISPITYSRTINHAKYKQGYYKRQENIELFQKILNR